MKLMRYVLAVIVAFVVLSFVGLYINKASSNKAINKLFGYAQSQSIKDLSSYGFANDLGLDLSYEITESSFLSQQGFINVKAEDYGFEEELSLPIKLSFYPHKTKIEVDLNHKVFKEVFYDSLFDQGFIKQEYQDAVLADLDSKLIANFSAFPYYLEAILQVNKDTQALQKVFERKNMELQAQSSSIFVRYKENMFKQEHLSLDANNIIVEGKLFNKLDFNYNQNDIGTNDYDVNTQLHLISNNNGEIVFTAHTKDTVFDEYKSVDFNLYGSSYDDIAKFNLDANIGLINVNSLFGKSIISYDDLEALLQKTFKDEQIYYTLRPSTLDIKADAVDTNLKSYIHGSANGSLTIKLDGTRNMNGKLKLQLVFDDFDDCTQMQKLLADFINVESVYKDDNTLLFDVEAKGNSFYVNGQEF